MLRHFLFPEMMITAGRSLGEDEGSADKRLFLQSLTWGRLHLKREGEREERKERGPKKRNGGEAIYRLSSLLWGILLNMGNLLAFTQMREVFYVFFKKKFSLSCVYINTRK